MTAYSFKKQFIGPIMVGLGYRRYEWRDLEPKRQTVRAIGKRRHARPGEAVQLYYGMRTKQCQKIGDARCTEVASVIIWVTTETIVIEVSKMMLSAAEMEKFARADGFAGLREMQDFWLKEHPGVEKFEGVLIKWEPVNG